MGVTPRTGIRDEGPRLNSFLHTSLLLKGRDAGAGISTERGVVHPRGPAVLERVTVTDLLTAESMTDTEGVRETSCAGVTTARSSEPTTTRRTTAVTCLRTFPDPQPLSSCPEHLSLLPRVRDVGAVTSTGGGVVLPSSPVVRERETVTDLETEESMTVTVAVELVWCAGLTTARSSEPTTTRRMTAARDQAGRKPPHSEVPPQAETGVPGRTGGVWLLGLSGGSRSAGDVSVLSEMGGWAVSTLRSDTPTLSVSETNQLLLSSIFIYAQHCNKYI